ncbi:MAG: glycine cleavage system protein GcvH [Casimicrobiaceae bacterium]|nr:glycine cleavage system protein GcvH [Casimicrobiaceae bacterium]MCX8099248.1 glycine cleavage system protein GcvH [Casimicrobiaceae bacterium]MDW8312759.1 glycine cleavage system protein GcvH [Burkholderiales bacterium]
MTIRYTEDHEWIRLEGDLATVGITHYAQDKLGDLVYVEQPKLGRRLKAREEAAIIESVKAAAEVKSPVAGEVVEVNQAVVDDPSLVNRDPEGAGWFFKLKVSNPADLDTLLDEAAYKASLA